MEVAIVTEVTTVEKSVWGGVGAGSGTCALRLGEAVGDDLPDASRQAGGPRVLGQARPQEAPLQSLRGKWEGLRGA